MNKHFIALAVLQIACMSAQAAPLYFSGEPVDSANTLNTILNADDFSLDHDSVISGVQFYALAETTFNIANTNLSYLFYSDADGLPSSTPITHGVAEQPSVQTIRSQGGASEFLISFRLAEPVSVYGGKRYWLALHAGVNYDIKQEEYLSWSFIDSITGRTNTSAFSLDAGVTWNGRSEDRAFMLIGSPSAVPEPSTMALLVNGTLALGVLSVLLRSFSTARRP